MLCSHLSLNVEHDPRDEFGHLTIWSVVSVSLDSLP